MYAGICQLGTGKRGIVCARFTQEPQGPGADWGGATVCLSPGNCTSRSLSVLMVTNTLSCLASREGGLAWEVGSRLPAMGVLV